MPKIYHFDKFKHVDIFQKEIGYFLTLSETLNISKAAEALGVQQPAISRALVRLEEDLGQKLFTRKSNGIALTESGQHFLSAIKNTKRAWEEHFLNLLEMSEEPSGLIKIGLHPSIGQKFLPRITSDLTSAYPQLELEVNALPSLQVTRKVLDNELDFGIVASPIKQPEIVTKFFGEDFLAVYQRSPQNSPRHILFNPEMQMSNAILKKLKGLKRVAIRDYELLAKTAIETNHLALLPNSVAENYEKLQQVSGALSKVRVHLITHKDKLRSKAYKKIWDLIATKA